MSFSAARLELLGTAI